MRHYTSNCDYRLCCFAPDLLEIVWLCRVSPVLCRYEAHHGVRITDTALAAAAALGDRYLPDRHLPDKAIDLIDEAAAKVGRGSVQAACHGTPLTLLMQPTKPSQKRRCHEVVGACMCQHMLHVALPCCTSVFCMKTCSAPSPSC